MQLLSRVLILSFNFNNFFKWLHSQIPQLTIRKLLSSSPPSESNMFRIDFRSTHVHYLNNLEEDAMYKRWRSNLNEVVSLSSTAPVFISIRLWIRLLLFPFLFLCRYWCQCSQDNCVIFVKTFSMQFMFLIRLPFVALRQVLCQTFFISLFYFTLLVTFSMSLFFLKFFCCCILAVCWHDNVSVWE